MKYPMKYLMKDFVLCFQAPTLFHPLKGQMSYCWDFTGIRASLQKAVKYNLVEHYSMYFPSEPRTLWTPGRIMLWEDS